MDPRLDDQEQELVRKARAAAEQHVAPRAAAADRDAAAPRDVIAALGGAGIFADADTGPTGRTRLVLVAEEIGRDSASIATMVVGHMVSTALLAGAEAGAASRVAPELQTGAAAATLAFDAGDTILEDPRPLAAAPNEAGCTIDGRAAAVAGATVADWFLVPVQVSGGRPYLALVAADTEGLSIGVEEHKLGLNGSGLATVGFAGVSAAADAMLGSGGGAAVETALDLLRIGHAAACVGVARAALEISTRRVLDGDESLATSQSVQWMLADAATESEAARLLTWYAASLPAGREFSEAAAMARLVASDAAVKASRSAVQIAGGSGDSRAAGIERLFRDAKSLEVHHGAREAQRRAVARHLLPDLVDVDASS